MAHSASFSPAPHILFDRRLLKERRNRVASSFSSYTFLKDSVVRDLASRLKFIRRSFQHCVDLGGHTGHLAATLPKIPFVTTDLSAAMIAQVSTSLKVVLDEEALPFAKNSLDLVMSALSLHWVNDFPGLLAQVFHCLKPDGLLLISLFGGETLIELRDCLFCAELELTDGVTPRISPMISVKDAGSLLQRANFSLPVVDSNRIQLMYPHPRALLHDLQKMGETNVLQSRSRKFLRRSVLNRAFELYRERYGLTDGRVSATFDIITLTGWAPHASQQTPLPRGSATLPLKDYV